MPTWVRLAADLWTTPDQASLDAETGGIEIWPVRMPEDWDFSHANVAGLSRTKALFAMNADSSRATRNAPSRSADKTRAAAPRVIRRGARLD